MRETPDPARPDPARPDGPHSDSAADPVLAAPGWNGRRRRARRGTGPWRHLRRALGAERNPLCRPLDRARSLIALLSAGWAVATVVGAWAVAGAMFRADQAVVAGEQTHRHLVAAVSLDPAATGVDGTAEQARARWSYPARRPHTALITVPQGTRAGDTVTVWVDDTGHASDAPGSRNGATADAAVAGATVLTGGLALLVLGSTLAGHALDARAARVWAREWARVEPGWSGRAGRRPHGRG